MKSRILLAAALLSMAATSVFAAKGDPTGFRTLNPGASSPDGTPTLTFQVNIAPNNTENLCASTLNAPPPPGEPIVSVNLGPNAVVTGVGTNTTHVANAPSWRSENTIAFYTPDGLQATLAPGTDDSAGGPTPYVFGPIDFTDNGFPNLNLGPTGILRLGLCEAFNDASVNPDGAFVAPSTVTIQCNNCVDPTAVADLALTQSNNQSGALLVGSTFQKTLTVTNNGPGNATAITVSDTLPPQLTFVSSTCGAVAAGQVVTYTIPTLANAAVSNCSITVSVNSTGTIVNTATITASAPADPTAANNTTSQQIGPTGGGVAQTAVPALDGKSLLVLLGLVTLLGMVALRQRQA